MSTHTETGNSQVASDNLSHPLIVSFVSGKGGVGKTMLAVAFAKEMSLANRTLILDLDFFNRGLTGLMGDGEPVAPISSPQFLISERGEASDQEGWSLVRVSENLFHVSYPHLTQREMQLFEELGVEDLKESLQDWVLDVASKCQAQCIVIDCHGGPDNSSFAACLLSDYSLLISEPDRITFFGTFNFLRTLETLRGAETVDLRLVFNKVIPAFSSFFLTSFYNRNMRQHFGGKPLAAIFPLEIYLTKEFEKTPFLTSAYPASLLARKTRVLIYELLGLQRKEKTAADDHRKVTVPRAIAAMPRWLRVYSKFSLGKTVFLLDCNFIMATIVAVVVALGTWEVLWNVWGKNWVDQEKVESLERSSPALVADWMQAIQDYAQRWGERLSQLALAWVCGALFIGWSRDLERQVTYCARSRRYGAAAGRVVVMAGLWVVVVALLGMWFQEFSQTKFEDLYGFDGTMLLVALVVPVLMLLGEAFRAYRDLRYERMAGEAIFRLGFVVAAFVWFFASGRLFG